jgi:hypothetical protein
METPADEEHITSEQPHEADIQEPSSSEKGSIVVLQPPSPNRPRPRDEYDVTTLDDMDPEPTKKPAKRLRRVAKPPIVDARTSKGGPIPSKLRRPAASQINGQASVSVAVPTTNGESEEGQQSTPKKRGPGRPPKKKPTPVKSAQHLEADAAMQDAEDNTPARVDRALGGVAGILQTPSPVKPPHVPRRQEQKRPQKTKALPIQLAEPSDDMEKPTKEGKQSTEANGEPEDKDLEDVDEDFEDDVEDDQEDHPLYLDAAGSSIEIQQLKEIREIAYRVGCAKVGAKWKWKEDEQNEREKRAALFTEEGKRVKKRIDKLRTSFDMLRDARWNADMTAYQKSEDEINLVIASLAEDINNFIETWFDKPNAKKKPLCFYDVYYTIIPSLMDVIVVYTKRKLDHGNMNDEDLQEFRDLVDMSWILAKSAGEQDKKFQPRSKSYQIDRPTKEIEPKLLAILRKLNKELKGREKAKKEVVDRERREADRERKVAEREERMAEQKRIRLADEERDRREHEHKRKQNAKAQRATFYEKLKDPFIGEMLRRAVEKADPKRETSRAPTRSLEHVEDDIDMEDDDDDPFRSDLEDAEPPERVSVFGTNNVNNPGQAKPLSFTEKQIFIDIMKNGYGSKISFQLHYC